MEQKTGMNKKKRLWLIICLVAVAVLAVAAVLVVKFCTADHVPELYWNVEREKYTDPDTGLSIREPADDGLYHVRFAYNGEQVEIPVADKELVAVIDALSVMELARDKDGLVTAVNTVENAASVLCEQMYVQEIKEDTLVLNSSIGMNGKQVTVKITEQLRAFNVSQKAAIVGQEIGLKDLQAMDTVNIYGILNPKGKEPVATHIFVIRQWEIGKIYWRTERLYDSKTKGTTRVPDENGVYTVAFYCDGETVELKFKDKVLVDNVDYVSANSCYFGFEFQDGYVVKILGATKSTHTVLQCERFDIVQLSEDGSYVAADRLGTSGREVQGVIGESCAIYDISPVARIEGKMNQKVDKLKLNDRVTIWTDTVGNPVLIYVTSRRADSPAYYNPDPQYDSNAKQTTRTPNADGYYEIELLKAGETELQTYYVKDVANVNTIDSAADRCVGLKVGQGNVVEYVYSINSIYGNTYLCRGYTVKEAYSSVIIVASSSGKTVKTGVLATDCKIWNVSDDGGFGTETTFREGDYVYAIKGPTDEVVLAYILRRAENKESGT